MVKVVGILKDVYFDSVMLMGAAARVKSNEGVIEAACFMGTPANKKILAASGFTMPEVEAAGPGDTILGIEAVDAATADTAVAEVKNALMGKKGGSGATGAAEARTRSLGGAIRQAQAEEQDANLAFISLPGRYAESEAMRALKRGLNVFLFSDNVPVEAEVRLKTEAVARDLLCMGPDCGTAWIGGVGLGFANEVPRGRVGLISASGTGLQTVACLLAANGEGVSHGIGVGGRDLSSEVGARMTLLALKKLQKDPATEAIVIISKPPAPEVITILENALKSVDKPVVVACLGAPQRESNGVIWEPTLVGAAEAMLASLQKRPRSHVAFSNPQLVRDTVDRYGSKLAGKPLLGLYTGGTLAHEAEIVIQPLLGEVAYGDESALAKAEHCILDLGDDQYTQGRPHPMIDPQTRNDLLLKFGAKAGVVLLDVVLGRCSHADPAGTLAQAITKLRQQLGDASPVFVASVVGTSLDSQNLAKQEAALRDAGVVLMPDNAQATRLAALLLAPEKTSALLPA